MKRIHIAILLLTGCATALFSAAGGERGRDWLPTLCIRWLLAGDIEHRWSDKAASNFGENVVLSLRGYIEKKYADAIPVVVGHRLQEQTWFSFVRTNQTLVPISFGTNTVASPALQIIPLPLRSMGNTQEVMIVYSLIMIQIDVISKEGEEPRVILTNFEISD